MKIKIEALQMQSSSKADDNFNRYKMPITFNKILSKEINSPTNSLNMNSMKITNNNIDQS